MRRKRLSTPYGADRTKIHDTISMSSNASSKPSPGDRKMAATVLPTPDQTTAWTPALARPAPTKPPISACELDDGIPSRWVKICQTIAPASAPKITRELTTSASTIPRPTVSATCSPKNRNAIKLKNAAQATAYCGRKTRVDTIVAIEFAASFMPLRKSNASATAISANRNGRVSAAASIVVRPRIVYLNMLDDDAVHDVGYVVETVHDLFQMIVDLVADEEGHWI